MAEEVTAQFARLHDQNMAGMGQVLTRVLSDAATISKAADYSFLQDKNMVSLPESLGAREVGSEKNPGGPSKPV